MIGDFWRQNVVVWCLHFIFLFFLSVFTQTTRPRYTVIVVVLKMNGWEILLIFTWSSFHNAHPHKSVNQYRLYIFYVNSSTFPIFITTLDVSSMFQKWWSQFSIFRFSLSVVQVGCCTFEIYVCTYLQSMSTPMYILLLLHKSIACFLFVQCCCLFFLLQVLFLKTVLFLQNKKAVDLALKNKERGKNWFQTCN